MKIHEYQAKSLFAKFEVPVPQGDVAKTPAEACAIAERLGGQVVVKSQIHAGGRGKGGGIKVVHDVEAAEQAASALNRQHVGHAADRARGSTGDPGARGGAARDRS